MLITSVFDRVPWISLPKCVKRLLKLQKWKFQGFSLEFHIRNFIITQDIFWDVFIEESLLRDFAFNNFKHLAWWIMQQELSNSRAIYSDTVTLSFSGIDTPSKPQSYVYITMLDLYWFTVSHLSREASDLETKKHWHLHLLWHLPLSSELSVSKQSHNSGITKIRNQMVPKY